MKNLVKLVTLALLSALLALPINGQASQAKVNWLGANADWQPQDYFDSRGIIKAHFADDRLVLSARLLTRHNNYGRGEVLLDTKYFTEVACQWPLDFSERELTVEVEVPDGFAGTESDPSRLYLFLKDARHKSFYGEATNVTRGGKFRLTLKLPASAFSSPAVEPAFNPASIRLIGIKFELGAAPLNKYKGPLYLTSVSVNPPFMASTPPDLPTSTPWPILSPEDKIEVRNGSFYLNDQKWFIVGANWRLIEYGQNFGVTAWFPSGNGVAKHSNFIRLNLDTARRAGLKLLRVGLLDDGRVMFDQAGQVIGYDETFRQDLRTLLDLAQQAGIKIEFTLLDFLIAGQGHLSDGVWLRGRRNVIVDPALRADFRAKFLVPFLHDFGNHPALFGFDLINEPEWLISRAECGGWEDYKDEPDQPSTKAEEPVPYETLQAFLAECASDIRQLAPNKLLTVGVSAKFIPLVSNLTILDYLAPHHYHWMDGLPSYLPSLKGRTWTLEEFPTKFASGALPGSIREYLDLVFTLRGAGALFWNLTPEIDDKTFSCLERAAQLVEIRHWVERDIYQSQPLVQGSSASLREDDRVDLRR